MIQTIADQIQSYEDYLIMKNFSSATRKMYLRTLKSYLKFHNKKFLDQNITQDSAKQFIIHRHKQGRSWSTINCDYSSLRKYFREVIYADWSLKKMPRPRKEKIIPTMISKKDVVKLINQAGNYKQQVFICFVYATGLRLSEALNIKFEDIDRDRLQIHVHRGKGAKDRIIHIPQCLLTILTDYYKYYKPENYLFNGLKKGHKYSHSAAQWIMRQARKNTKFTKKASIHTLRHAFATHHLESGTDLVYLKSQLGHKHLKTTEQYIHLCVNRVRTINHPITELIGDLHWINRSATSLETMQKNISESTTLTNIK